MDGVIADTALYHFKAWQDVFQKRGVSYTEADFKSNFGRRNDTIIRNMIGGSLPADRVEEIAGEKEGNYRQRVAQNIKPLPGAIELIRALKERGVKMAIASSAPTENIQLILRGLGIGDYFQVIVSGRQVSEGKPSPQGFLLAARKLEVAPENCVVIEDAIDGVAGARRAGMKCLAVTSNHPRQSLAEADRVVDTLEAVNVDDLPGLFEKGSLLN